MSIQKRIFLFLSNEKKSRKLKEPYYLDHD